MAKLKWTDMEKPLSSSIYDVIQELKFEKMTPVQVSTIFANFLNKFLTKNLKNFRLQQFHYYFHVKMLLQRLLQVLVKH